MNVAFRPDPVARSPQARPVLPDTADSVHPRAAEMADAMLDIAARGAGASTADLIREGFTSAEIIEFGPQAQSIAGQAAVRQTARRPDLVADIVAKARAPLPNSPPLPRATQETQALMVAWRFYCASHAALILDPWPGQRERCLKLLEAVLDRTALFEANRRDVLNQTAETLQRIGR